MEKSRFTSSAMCESELFLSVGVVVACIHRRHSSLVIIYLQELNSKGRVFSDESDVGLSVVCKRRTDLVGNRLVVAGSSTT